MRPPISEKASRGVFPVIRRFSNWIGLDHAIFFTVLARFWQAFAALVTLGLVSRFLSASEQGYYYTFYSIVALQIVFELGFSFVILQLAAHERAKLTLDEDGTITGDPVSYGRLASTLRKAIRWYLIAGWIMAIVLVPAGFIFFSAHATPGTDIGWRMPWLCLVLVNMFAFQIDPVFSFLEGCGYVAEVARRRFWQALVGSLLAWTAMISHHGLYGPALLITGQVMIGAGYLFFSRHKRILQTLLQHPSRQHEIVWRTDIWPFQWKIAVSWICGYFIYQLFSPILFAYQGPIIAGRMGMSLNVASGIGSIAMAWMNTKAAPFGQLVAKGDFQELDRLFFRTLKQSTLLLFLGCSAFVSFMYFGSHQLQGFIGRLLPLPMVVLLLLHTIMNHVVYSEALYLRSHKMEPFVVQAVCSAVLVAGSTYILGRYYGANAVVIGLVVQGLVFGLPTCTYIFLSCRHKWRRVQEEINV